jgi:predicted amidohydrolase YtcJ
VTAYLFTGILTAAIIGILWVSILLILGLKQKNEEQPTVEMDKKMDYPHPVLLVSKGGKVKYHNDEMARLVGLKNGQDFDINTLAKKSKKKDFYRIFT